MIVKPKGYQAAAVDNVLDIFRYAGNQIDAAPGLDFLRVPPSNRLEKLRGDLAGYWSLRINDQWRIIFRWENKDALDVEITDYH